MSHNRQRTQSSSFWRKAFLALLFLAYVAGGLYFGYLFSGTMRALVQKRSLPAVQEKFSGAIRRQRHNDVQQPGNSAPAPEETPVPSWDHGRVNILLLGVDQRACEDTGGAWRTDTMILASLDPRTKTASLLSFPRDLWVEIPTVGPNRLNAAHFFGDAYDYPGGGPALAKHTIQNNFAVAVHYYIRINFDGFRQVVDALGGIDIEVQEPIWDDHYPTDDCRYQTVQFDEGQYHMGGDQALKYARSRHYTSDFDRARRQQQVLFAIYEKATSIQVIPRLPKLWTSKDEAIQTDLSLIDAMKLARLGIQINPDNIRHGVIDESMTHDMTTDKGWQVLNWDREKVGALVRDLFGATGGLSESAPSN